MAIPYLLSLALMFAAVSLFTWNFFGRRSGTLSIGGMVVHSDDVSKLPSIFFKLPYPLLDALAARSLRGVAQFPPARGGQSQKAGIGSVITPDHLLAMKASSR